MVISMTWCVLRRFCGAWVLCSHLLVSCSWGTMSTEGRMESRYVFDRGLSENKNKELET